MAGGDPSAGEVEAQRSAVQGWLWQLASKKPARAPRYPGQEKPKRKTLYPSQSAKLLAVVYFQLP